MSMLLSIPSNSITPTTHSFQYQSNQKGFIKTKMLIHVNFGITIDSKLVSTHPELGSYILQFKLKNIFFFYHIVWTLNVCKFCTNYIKWIRSLLWKSYNLVITSQMTHQKLFHGSACVLRSVISSTLALTFLQWGGGGKEAFHRESTYSLHKYWSHVITHPLLYYTAFILNHYYLHINTLTNL